MFCYVDEINKITWIRPYDYVIKIILILILIPHLWEGFSVQMTGA